MSNISKWVSVEEIPFLKNAERLMSIIYTLGIATREQLETITGWSKNKIQDTIREIRNMEPTPATTKKRKEMLSLVKKGELQMDAMEREKLEFKLTKELQQISKKRDEWLTILQPTNGFKGVSYYTLGIEGMDLVREIREDYRGKKGRKFKENPKRQVRHFCGINEVLCRLRRSEVEEAEWLSGREIGQELYYHWRRQFPDVENYPYKPDAYLALEGEDQDYKFYIEFDTGSEGDSKLRSRFYNTLSLYNLLDDPKRNRLPNDILWIVTSENRKKKIIPIADGVLQDFREDFAQGKVSHLKPIHNKRRLSRQKKQSLSATVSTKKTLSSEKREAKQIRIPNVYIFVEGEDTKYLLGEVGATPMWVGEGLEPIQQDKGKTLST
jgi:hypothetical protein